MEDSAGWSTTAVLSPQHGTLVGMSGGYAIPMEHTRLAGV